VAIIRNDFEINFELGAAHSDFGPTVTSPSVAAILRPLVRAVLFVRPFSRAVLLVRPFGRAALFVRPFGRAALFVRPFRRAVFGPVDSDRAAPPI
jgi:hypothetical protein